MTKKEIFIKENVWSQTLEQISIYADFFDKTLTKDSKVLLIGTGYEDRQYYDWPNLLLKLESTIKIKYLEICDSYIEKWKNSEFEVIKGNVQDIDKIFKKDEFDVICWIQGPEHVKQDEMYPTFEKIFNCAKKGVLFSCPWGKYYDYQEELNNNFYEKHINKSMGKHSFSSIFNDYQIYYCDKEHSENGGIIIIRIKE